MATSTRRTTKRRPRKPRATKAELIAQLTARTGLTKRQVMDVLEAIGRLLRSTDDRTLRRLLSLPFDRGYVLDVLVAGTSGSFSAKRKRLKSLRPRKPPLVKVTVQEAAEATGGLSGNPIPPEE